MKERLAGCFVAVMATAFGMVACGGGNEPNQDDQHQPKQEKEQQPVQAKQ